MIVFLHIGQYLVDVVRGDGRKYLVQREVVELRDDKYGPLKSPPTQYEIQKGIRESTDSSILVRERTILSYQEESDGHPTEGQDVNEHLPSKWAPIGPCPSVDAVEEVAAADIAPVASPRSSRAGSVFFSISSSSSLSHLGAPARPLASPVSQEAGSAPRSMVPSLEVGLAAEDNAASRFAFMGPQRVSPVASLTSVASITEASAGQRTAAFGAELVAALGGIQGEVDQRLPYPRMGSHLITPRASASPPLGSIHTPPGSMAVAVSVNVPLGSIHTPSASMAAAVGVNFPLGSTYTVPVTMAAAVGVNLPLGSTYIAQGKMAAAVGVNIPFGSIHTPPGSISLAAAVHVNVPLGSIHTPPGSMSTAVHVNVPLGSIHTPPGSMSTAVHVNVPLGSIHTPPARMAVAVSVRVTLPPSDMESLPWGLARLDRGSFGTILKGCWNGQMVAVKRMAPATESYRRLVYNEISFLKSCQGPFVVRYQGVFYDGPVPNVNIVTELLVCNVDDFLFCEKGSGLQFEEAQYLVGCVTMALMMMHADNVAHLDLKPENIGFNERGVPKLIDFGFATDDRLVVGVRGTLGFNTPPESISQPRYDPLYADIFAVGIFTYYLYQKRSPFVKPGEETELGSDRVGDEVKARLLYCDQVMAEADYSAIHSHDMRAFVRDIVRTNCNERLGHRGIDQLRFHRFFRNMSFNNLTTRPSPLLHRFI